MLGKHAYYHYTIPAKYYLKLMAWEGHRYFSAEKFRDPDSLAFARSVFELLHVFAIQHFLPLNHTRKTT